MQHLLGNPHSYTAEEAYELVTKPMYWWEVAPVKTAQQSEHISDEAHDSTTHNHEEQQKKRVSDL